MTINIKRTSELYLGNALESDEMPKVEVFFVIKLEMPINCMNQPFKEFSAPLFIHEFQQTWRIMMFLATISLYIYDSLESR